MKTPRIILRGEHYYLRRRVPVRYQTVEARQMIKHCLFTDSKQTAEKKAGEIWAQLIEAWEAKLDGHDTEGEERFEAARNLAQRRGYRFLDIERVARLPLEEILNRIEAVASKGGKIDRQEADALLGLARPGKVRVSEAVEKFYEVASDRLHGKSPDQTRRHKEARRRATNNFMTAVGDMPLAEISTDDLFQFRDWWMRRVSSGAASRGTANKDIAYLGAMWRAVAQAKSIRLKFDTKGVALRETPGRKRTRPPFTDGWIREKILAPGALGKLDTEARIILLGMINTGYRPSEGAALTPDRIRLDTEVPHIEIAPGERTLKSGYSERIIPLTGISLEAFREHPTGFPRYADSPALSTIINRYLRSNGLLETPKHSLYGLRHSFEDRMLEAKIDERIRRDLLGHSLNRVRYGQGGELKYIRSLLEPVAL